MLVLAMASTTGSFHLHPTVILDHPDRLTNLRRHGAIVAAVQRDNGGADENRLTRAGPLYGTRIALLNSDVLSSPNVTSSLLTGGVRRPKTGTRVTVALIHLPRRSPGTEASTKFTSR